MGRSISTDRKMQVLAAIADGATLKEAAAEARVSTATVHRWRRKDNEFDAAFQEAAEAGAEVINHEIHRRAIKGYREPVFHDGKICGYKRRYSDSLLIRLAEQRIPGFRQENSQVQINFDLGTIKEELTRKLIDITEARRAQKISHEPD